MSISGVRLPCLCVYIIGIEGVKGVKGVNGVEKEGVEVEAVTEGDGYEFLKGFIEDDGVGDYESGFRVGFYC